MIPLVTFADPERVLIDYLKAKWAGRAEAFKPATLTNAFPVAPLAGNATHVQVALDGAVDEYPVTERATVRVTFYSAPSSQDNAKNGAAVTRALCLTHPGDVDIAGVSAGTGRLKTVDPDTGNNMVTFTVRVSLIPHLLTA